MVLLIDYHLCKLRKWIYGQDRDCRFWLFSNTCSWLLLYRNEIYIFEEYVGQDISFPFEWLYSLASFAAELNESD